ncbi:hypothetical protein [Hymenobacter siberiensis]|uniref:hypothetical protein n=1 Tax=Hymenobacter siberiensis TaxID=2848396 RepID=UPI001C1E74A8|nr:hypothetical protein [Hymenobacter siberiensis]
MGHLGQPQQSAPYRVDNIFQSVQMDTPPDNTPSNVLTSARNGHLLRHQGSEVVWQTEPGMARAFAIPINHLVHGWAERSGVLYLLLMATTADGSGPELKADGTPTGRGELGCWPSPAYAYVDPNDPASELVEEGPMLDHYGPLRVYYGDFDGSQPTSFSSAHFNLALESPSELELQDSYDGTLNIIINDGGRNPALLINSGFALEPATDNGATDQDRYRVIVREGAAQTNRYRPADFTSRLRLHPKGGSLAKAYVTDVSDGGQLPGGEYRYYFTYADADNNETAVFAECGPVPVFNAATPADATGARAGQGTTRRVQLRLEQLDPTFGYVRVRYVRRAGEVSAVAQGYLLDQRLSVSAQGVVEFSHTGYEQQTGLSIDQLQAAAGSLSVFTTMCQAGNRLLLANVRQNAVADAPLLAFARSLQLSHQQVALPGVPGLDNGIEAGAGVGAVPGIYGPLSFGGFTGAAAGLTPHTDPRGVWNGGHFNPLNATYRRGYPAGEAVAFGVRFVLNDYSLSDTYPLTGGDNLPNTLHYDNLDPAGVFPAVFAPDGWSQAFGFGTYNHLGVYRFPDTNAVGMKPLVEANSNAVNILAACIKVLDGVIPEDVRGRTVGVQFMRATRVPNRLAQGYVLPTLKSLVTPPGNNVFDQHHPDMRTTLAGGPATGNLKVLPTVGGLLEAVDRNYGITANGERGVMPFVFNRQTTVESKTYDLHDPRRGALYAPDALLRPTVYLPRLNQRDVQARIVGLVYFKPAVRYTNTVTTGGSFGTIFAGAAGTGSVSLYKTTHQTTIATAVVTGQSFWTLDKQFAVNDGRFGSAEKFLLGKNDGSDKKYLINLAWTPYVGLRLNQDLTLSTIMGTGSGNTGFGADTLNLTGDAPQAKAFLVNLYNNGGLLTTDSLKNIYRPEALSYLPISQRLSWQELQEQLDGNDQLPLYGGDTYVAPMYRRLTRPLKAGERKDEKFDAPVGQVMSFVCETSANPYARSDAPASTGEDSNASYVPRLGAGEQKFDAFRLAENVTKPESETYNAGYTAEDQGSPALVQGVARVEGVPFRARAFQARVWASAASVDGSFNNGYRFLPALGFRDYERRLGPITRLMPAGNQQVLIVHTHGLEVITINERVLTGQGAGPVYAQGLDFLPPTGRIVSAEMGCQHPQGVCVTPAGVYGLDASRQYAWFWAFGAEKATPISGFSVNQLVAPALKQYQGGTVRLGEHDVRATYDPERGDVVFSLYRRALNGVFVHQLNAIYNEPLKAWMGEHDYYRPQALLAVPRRGMFSLPLAGESATVIGGYSLWRHRVLPASGPDAQRAGGYGRAHDAHLEFVVLGPSVDTTKMLDNLVLVSEGRDADVLEVITAEQPTALVQALVGAPADITRRTAQRREGHTWVTVTGTAKRRGRWIRLRLRWLAEPTTPNATLHTGEQDAGRLFKATSIVRDSFV